MKSKLPEGWKEVELGEIFEYRSGLSKGRKYFGTGYPYLSFKEIFYNFFVPENLKELVEVTENERNSMSIEEGDVFLTRTSETFDELGMSSVALKDYKDATFNGFTKRLRPKIKDVLYPKFSGYYFRSKRFREQVDSIATMTTRASLNNSMLDILKIIIPSYKEQRVIADTLSALDDKIELNNKINENLEKQAQAIFKHWFIDFEFPDENGNPYKSSGGQMVESELGMIPKGWGIYKLATQVDIELGGTPARKQENYWDGDINWINSGELNSYRIFRETEKITEEGLKNSSTKLWPKNTTVIAITGATLGKTSLLLINTCANQSVVGIKENSNIPYTFIYPYIVSRIPELISHQTGGAQQHINKGNIGELSVLLPDKDILFNYHNTIKSHYEYIEANEFENINLSKLRDTLLPKLMSGEIRIPLD